LSRYDSFKDVEDDNNVSLEEVEKEDGYDEEETFDMLKHYGIKLSNYERQINLGDLNAEYMLLIEAPQDKVDYILNNMDNIVLTIPTSNAPNWMINEINETYQY
jgi:hypothetical protein